MLPNFHFDRHARKGTRESKEKLRFGLCLSGGGTRAAIFHLGVMTGLHRLGVLEMVDRIAAVSGGSITAAMYGLARARAASKGQSFVFEDFLEEASLALSRGFRNRVIWGLANPRFYYRWLVHRHTRTDLLASAYDSTLFDRASLEDLCEQPEIYLTSTCLNDGLTWIFSRKGLDRVIAGSADQEKAKTDIPLSLAVAASSAVPGLFPPICRQRSYFYAAPDPNPELLRYEVLHFSDGGVADNLGMIGMYTGEIPDVVLVSDASAGFSFMAAPPRSVVLGLLPVVGRHLFGGAGVLTRTMEIMMYHMHQFVSTASQPHLAAVDQFIASIASPVENGLESEIVSKIAKVRTDLDRFSKMEFFAIFLHGLSHGTNWILGRYGFVYGRDETTRKQAQIDQPSKEWKARALRHLSHSNSRSWIVRRALRIATTVRAFKRPQPGDEKGWDHLKEPVQTSEKSDS